ncbi:Flavocytochrome yedZ [Delftia tsuruhatensis]|uniref:sulfite oxidase heme-binding subunit YedZ n=1 Tax=Delftia tsuruhatensis TaxID=180282 RepID=UPI001E7009B2|nr:protein-methionine-sulfoxide reductase heme-binding subunit MsrQ [Delftia tsuruhatensis]CAB5664837.1 Flavocytochrome yedZ [Delftia tsuruhatensis]CAC9677474.1 Flavocytochrome yedZ [Delftia tsuruhatensis]
MPAAVTSAQRLLLHRAARPLVFLLCLLPFAWLVAGALANTLGANPAEALLRSTGDWTLRLLCVVLAVTPLRQALGLTALARFRRMLGLYVFFYALLHLLCYAWFDMGLDWVDIVHDIPRRPFILVGFVALLLLTLLAATSPRTVVRAMGGQRWQRLHRLVYAVVPLALLHFFWMRAGKNNFAEVAVYAAILGLLLAWRAGRALRRRSI